MDDVPARILAFLDGAQPKWEGMVDNPPEKSDWSDVERSLEKRSGEEDEGEIQHTPSLDAPQDPEESHPLMERFGGPSGVVMEFKAGRIQKKHALEALEAWHKGQLEVAETQVRQAVRIHTAQARSQAERFLAEISSEHLSYLADLGLQNVNERQKMLNRLIEQTSRNLDELQELDAPEPLKDQGVQQIMDMHDEFADKLREDLGEIETPD